MKNQINLRGTLHAYDWLSDIHYAPEQEVEIVQVLFKNTRSGFFINPDRIPLKKNDWVAVDAAPGHDIGRVMLTGPLVRLQMKKANAQNKEQELKRIFRKASQSDIEKFEAARAREHETMIRSRQIAAELGLNMKIGDVEFQGDGAKAIFYYIADERVDFRKLIRILADTFKIRIEMKQIGARQEAGRIGGIGPCGRPLCCASWMSKFVSVGTGAARIQDLSMNPQKLAGQCAKLKCCLNFETDIYAEASKKLPPKDAVLITQDAEYYQFKVDILASEITYSTDKHIAANLVTISAARAFEIIELNKQGAKPEQLLQETPAKEVKKEYVELVGQDSLTRFDKSKGKKKKGAATERKRSEANRSEKQTPTNDPDKNADKNLEKHPDRQSDKNGSTSAAGQQRQQKRRHGSQNSQRKERPSDQNQQGAKPRQQGHKANHRQAAQPQNDQSANQQQERNSSQPRSQRNGANHRRRQQRHKDGNSNQAPQKSAE